MEKQVIFRDYQEQQAQDHNDLQTFARAALDHIVVDAVTTTRRYAGFSTQKTAQAEVQVAAGRFYDVAGAVYGRTTVLTQSMIAFLPAVSQRIVSLTAYGTETETDVEERDFLVDVDTGRTEPEAVATTRSRDAVLAFVVGTESADPQAPAIPVTSVEIARIRLDPVQVVSVEMMVVNEVASTEDLDTRADALEAFDQQIGPRVQALASDLATLAEQMKTKSSGFDATRIYEDLARVKARVELPSTFSDFGADRFLNTNESDVYNTKLLGYDARVQEGIRFAPANEDLFEANIFSANDPNAHLQGGLLLPAFDDIKKIEIGPFHSSIGIAQYGFQTHNIVHKQIARERLRYGDWFTVCTNASWWRTGTYDPIAHTFLKDGETYQVGNVAGEQIENAFLGLTHFVRVRQFWRDTYMEDYWEVVIVNVAISGAQVAQSVLIANDMWLTKLGFFMTAKAANENVYLDVCELTAGVPDLSKAILHQSVPHTDLIVGDWTEVNVMPTFLKGGKRYAIVVTSNANHQFGMAFGQTYLDGTFFFSTDGAYFLGDLTKDIMFRLYGAKFRAPQVTIELTALNLDGGIRAIDILAGLIQPDSTSLVYEVRPNGSGAWIPLDYSDLTAFQSTPPLAQFRARFVGTRDMHAGLMLTGSQVRLFRPKLTFRHVSTTLTLAANHSELRVKVIMEDFNETPHDLTAKIWVGSPLVALNPVSIITTTIDAAAGRYSREWEFNPSAPVNAFTVEFNGTTNSAGNVFHIAERIYWSLN